MKRAQEDDADIVHLYDVRVGAIARSQLTRSSYDDEHGVGQSRW